MNLRGLHVVQITAVSKGAPRMAISYVVSGCVKQRVCGRWAKVEIPENPH